MDWKLVNSYRVEGDLATNDKKEVKEDEQSTQSDTTVNGSISHQPFF